jgi:hypothetical protein
MPLLTGTWNINVNGTEGNFNIVNLQPDGIFSGSVLDVPCNGVWNEAAQMIYFESNLPSGGGNTYRAQFIGYLFSTPPVAAPGLDIKWTICGSAIGAPVGAPLANMHPTSRRFSFGWMATVTQVM